MNILRELERKAGRGELDDLLEKLRRDLSLWAPSKLSSILARELGVSENEVLEAMGEVRRVLYRLMKERNGREERTTAKRRVHSTLANTIYKLIGRRVYELTDLLLERGGYEALRGFFSPVSPQTLNHVLSSLRLLLESEPHLCKHSNPLIEDLCIITPISSSSFSQLCRRRVMEVVASACVPRR